jgi:hypothetical protein
VPTVSYTVTVPDLRGLPADQARGIGAKLGLLVEVDYEPGITPDSPAQQAPPQNLRVLRQSPEPGTRVAPRSTIKVTLGSPAKQKASQRMDYLVPVVYAAEPESAPPRRSAPPADNAAARQPSGTTSSRASALPSRSAVAFPLDDDLLFLSCRDSGGCRVLGRSGRIYKIAGDKEWSFSQGRFIVEAGSTAPLSLLFATGHGSVIAKSGKTAYVCKSLTAGALLDDGMTMTCVEWSGVAVTPDLEIIDKDSRSITSGGSSPLVVAPIDTTATLRASTSEDSPVRFIVGDHGIILSTADGGDTWRHETQGPEGAMPNHRLPAMWYWVLASLLILTCTAVVAAPLPPPTTEFSVADWTVTDAPLKPGDLDSLDFTPMALGLSRFIRNPKTQPPVTIAIEGEWGEGKSSVMALLRGDLEKSRYRPVWFNAWHHQSEEQLLAALLQHVKEQAVPPWWHIDNWIFRARLLHYRLNDKWPFMILLGLALCASVSFELSRHGLRMDDFVKFGMDIVKLVKYFLPWSNQRELPDDLGHFSVMATVLAILAAIVKKTRAFGIDPSKLTDNLRDAATIKDVKPDPGVRPRFAREFGDLCNAWSWGGRRVIIFIDDLDRCRPESVVTVLESINFLTTAGDCMIVLGMAQNQVTHCVGLGFKEIAQAEAAYKGGGNTEQEKAIARFKYGEFYIKKLVNIVAPLPKTTPDQRRLVLELKAAEVRLQEQEQKAAGASWRARLWEGVSEAGRMTAKVAPVLGLVIAAVFSVVIGYQKGIPQPTAAVQQQAASSPEKVEVDAPQPSGFSKSGAAKPLAYDRPTSQRATLLDAAGAPGGIWWSYAVDALFLLVLFGILAYQLSARTNLDAQNSPEFEESLKLWGQYIVTICDTPREIKRALNDLRYQAMTRRANGPSSTRGERLLRILQQFITGRSPSAPTEKTVDEAALPPLKAAELANLTSDEWRAFQDPGHTEISGSETMRLLTELKIKHIDGFKRWIGEATPASHPAEEMAAQDNIAHTA